MGQIRAPKRVALFCGLLSSDEGLLAMARKRLAAQLGPIDAVSPVWPFTDSDYYRQEMGDDIVRQFVVFEALASIERIAEIKRLTNALERRICDDLGQPETFRPVNIDPGYITHAKIVLASTKDYTHRVHVQGGIYAEVTLHYENGAWRARPWTYPDYAAPTYHPFFEEAREAFREKLRSDA